LINEQSVLALITARGGSKGLPGKNIRSLMGKPLIAWSIEQAKACRYVDRVVVSTDDKDIAKIAKEYGAETPFLRPANLSIDTASTIDTVIHAINFIENQGDSFDFIILLEPTSPLRDVEDIEKALEKLNDRSGAESIVGVAQALSMHPSFLVRIINGTLKPFQGQWIASPRRQDLDEVYFFEGSLYISYCSSIKKRKSFYHDATLPYIMPKYKSYEIDEIDDFIIIEALLAAKKGGIFD
jgi:CMP-N,N'-diacetyllegionaminic acid synthase